jgi:16S rRNA processing protein RimM
MAATSCLKLKTDDWVAIGRVARPHGVQGSLKINPYLYNTQDWSLLSQIKKVQLFSEQNNTYVEFSAQRWLPRPPSTLILQLEGLDTRDLAESYRDWLLLLDRQVLAPTHYWTIETIGMTIVESSSSKIWGKVQDICHNGVYPLLKLTDDKLLPFVAHFIQKVDRQTQQIFVSLPPGLWDET